MSTSNKANYFSQIFSFSLEGERSEEELREKDRAQMRIIRLNQKLFVPDQKTADELFDPARQINAGPLFEESFGARQDETISVTLGENQKRYKIPFPSSFRECNLSEEILRNIQKRNYVIPTQIQKAAFPVIQKSQVDVIGRAQTGSGKTAAFLLPLINEIQKDYTEGIAQYNPDSPFVVLLATSKELVNQLYEDALSFALDTSVKIAVAHGDLPMGVSIRRLREGCDVLVTTMGRLVHYVKEKIIRLNKLRYLMIDEADRFLLIDRYLEELRIVKSQLSHKYRTLMMSATFDAEVQEAAKEFIQPGYCFISVKEKDSAANTVSQTVLEVHHYDKKRTLVDLLKRKSKEVDGQDGRKFYRTEKTLVFKNGNRECDRLGIALSYYGFNVITVNRNRTLQQRFEAVERFKSGEFDIIVVTDVLARGINLPNLRHVINFDMPRPEDYFTYVHRIGRTGRAGNIGSSISFFDPYNGADSQHAEYLVDVLERSNQIVPKFLTDIVQAQKEFNAQCRAGEEVPFEEW